MKTKVLLLIALLVGMSACKPKKQQTSSAAPVEQGTLQTPKTAPQALTFDSVRVEDAYSTKVNGETAEADFDFAVDFPKTGSSEIMTWIKNWLALEAADQNDSLRSTPEHAKDLLAKSSKAYKGDDVKAIGEKRKKLFFKSFKDEVVTPNEHAFNYSDGLKLSLVFETPSLLTYERSGYSYLGGAHGSSYVYYTVFDLEDKTTLTFDDIFLQSAKPQLRELILRELVKYFQVTNIEEMMEQIQIDDAYKNVQKFPFPTYTAPGLLSNGVAFIYQQYEIACYAAGMPSVMLTYKEVWDYLTPKAKQLLRHNVKL